jgi:hypothetical protein
MDSNVDLKVAAAHFLVAAAILEKIKIEASGLKSEEITLDLTETNLDICISMTRAQAQYCVYEKVKRINSNKFALLAQLAMQASVLYQKAYQLIMTTTMEQAKILRNFAVVLDYQAHSFMAQANYWAAQQCIKQMKETHKGIGVAIAYMIRACNSLKEVKDKERLPQSIVNQYETLIKHYSECTTTLELKNKKFHETIPTEVDKIECLQYSHPFSLEEDINRPFEGKNIIARLVPAKVHALINEYKSFVESIIAEATQSITISDRMQESFKKKHNLPASLYAASGDQKLPEDLSTKIQQCKEKGGMKLIHFRLEELNTTSETLEMKINNLLIQLQCEEEEDEDFRRKHGALCTQAKSKDLTQKILGQLKNFKEKLEKAKMVDTSVLCTLKKEHEYFELIELEKSELLSKIPKSSIMEKEESSVASKYFL